MADVQQRESALVETAQLVPPDRFHISAQSDGPGYGSALPYTRRLESGFAMVTPCTWAEVDMTPWPTWTMQNASDRLATGDIFASEIMRIGLQYFANIATHASVRTLAVPAPMTASDSVAPFELQPRSDVITVAFEIHADGKPRTVDEILAKAVTRDLLPHDERKKYVYAALKAYVEKMIARGLRPVIVQDPDRRFRSDEIAGAAVFFMFGRRELHHGPGPRD